MNNKTTKNNRKKKSLKKVTKHLLIEKEKKYIRSFMAIKEPIQPESLSC